MAIHNFVPFWCRTNPYQADPTVEVHGILYSAQQQIGPGEYICEGSRQIGMIGQKSVWLFGGYTDVMNSAGIKTIDSITELSDHEKVDILKQLKYKLDVEMYDAYSDATSIWFYEKPVNRKRKSPTPTARKSPTPTARKSRKSPTPTARKSRQTATRSPLSHLDSILELETPVKSPKRRRTGGYKRKIRKSKKNKK